MENVIIRPAVKYDLETLYRFEQALSLPKGHLTQRLKMGILIIMILPQ